MTKNTINFVKKLEITKLLEQVCKPAADPNGGDKKYAKYEEHWDDHRVAASIPGVNADNVRSIRQQLYGNMRIPRPRPAVVAAPVDVNHELLRRVSALEAAAREPKQQALPLSNAGQELLKRIINVEQRLTALENHVTNPHNGAFHDRRY